MAAGGTWKISWKFTSFIAHTVICCRTSYEGYIIQIPMPLPMFSSEPDPGKWLVTLRIDIDRFILWKTNMAAVHLEKLDIICKSAKD